MDCPDCSNAESKAFYPVYTVSCQGCAQRMVMNENCKLQRSMMAEYLEMRYSIATDWKKEPSCKCKDVCERRKNVKSGKEML